MSKRSVNSEALARQLETVIQRRGLKYEDLAKATGIDASRISRFCSADFKRVTPVLKKLCAELRVPWQKYVCENSVGTVAKDILKSVLALTGQNPKKAKVVRRLIRSVEQLING